MPKGFFVGEPITLSLEEAFPTATKEQLNDLRKIVNIPTGFMVTSIDRGRGVITLEAVRKPDA